jgi:hypothetical protein
MCYKAVISSSYWFFVTYECLRLAFFQNKGLLLSDVRALVVEAVFFKPNSRWFMERRVLEIILLKVRLVSWVHLLRLWPQNRKVARPEGVTSCFPRLYIFINSRVGWMHEVFNTQVLSWSTSNSWSLASLSHSYISTATIPTTLNRWRWVLRLHAFDSRYIHVHFASKRLTQLGL